MGPQPCLGDGVIGLGDLGCLLSKYRREDTDPEFDSGCDFNVDGVINLSDLAELLPRYGIEFDFVGGDTREDWEAARRPNTRAVYVETMTNPLLQVLP